MMRFVVFADFHYKKGMYAPTIGHDLTPIIERARLSGADMIIHAGDLCNDYLGSPELFDALLRNRYDIPVFGAYGNHELETGGNTMEVVTPRLANRPVVYGTPDGEFSADIGYYHVDVDGYRFVFADTNYSLLDGEWVHNRPASWGAPKGAEYENSLGPAQLYWLERVLTDASENGLRCVVVSHAEFSGKNSPSPDADKVREIFRRVNEKRKTVILAINGHYHTDNLFTEDGIGYFDCNTVKNGFWMPMEEQHYVPGQTFVYEDYDRNGTLTGKSPRDLCSLSQAKNTWFFDKPLCAVITIDDDEITIDGAQTSWMYDVVPETDIEGVRAGILSRKIRI